MCMFPYLLQFILQNFISGKSGALFNMVIYFYSQKKITLQYPFDSFKW